MFGLESTVTLINRVVDKDGKTIPMDMTFDGRPVKVEDRLVVPLGVGRILVHQSMYKLDLNTNIREYKLGCPELGLPTTPITEAEVHAHNELIDRSKMSSGANVKAVHINNPIMRTAPLYYNDPGGGDGAFPGFYSDKP